MCQYEVRIHSFPESKVQKTPGWVIRLLRESVTTTKEFIADNAEHCILQMLQARDPSATSKQIIEDDATEFDLKNCKWVAFVDKGKNVVLAEVHFVELGWVWTVPQYTFTPKELWEVSMKEEKGNGTQNEGEPLTDGLPKARILHQKYPKLIPQEESEDMLTIESVQASVPHYLDRAISFFGTEPETKSLVECLQRLRSAYPFEASEELTTSFAQAIQCAKDCSLLVIPFDSLNVVTLQEWLEAEASTSCPVEV